MSPSEHDEVAAVARELWRQRDSNGGSPEDDWLRAEQIVRARRQATVSAAGNPSSPPESNVSGTEYLRTDQPTRWKEHDYMENMTGNMGGETGSGVMDRGRNVMENMQGRMENQPQSFPRPEHREGRLARTIEQQTAKLPSDTFLWAAVGSIGLSLALELSGKEKTANFVGHWAPTLLILGLYNKLVKLQGSDGL